MKKKIINYVDKNRDIKIAFLFCSLLVISTIGYFSAKIFSDEISKGFSKGFLVILSLFLNYVLYLIIKKVSKNIKITRFYKIWTMVAIIICCVIYGYSLYKRRMIYYWDYSNYYKIQIYLEGTFNNGILRGCKAIISSLLGDDYSCFICIFMAAPFMLLKNIDIDNYIIIYGMLGTLPVIITTSMVIIKIIEKLKAKRPKLLFALSMTTIVLIPLLHYSALIGQPDLYGLIFVNLIIILTVDYNFKELEIERLVILFICTIALIFTRRWYMYWIVGYYVSYTLLIFIINIKEKDVLINYMKFAVVSLIIGGIGLSPMFYKILKYSYSDHYQAYYLGGFPYEITNQIDYLGYILVAFMMIGLVYGIINKNSRGICITLSLTLVIAMYLFTKVQNAGYHQSLIFLSTYIGLMVMFYCAVTSLKNENISRIGSVLIAVSMVTNFYVSINGYDSKKVFSNASLKPIVREDFNAINNVGKFIKENVNKDNTMYIIPHGTTYNPDIFRNMNLPNSFDDIIPYGSAVLGTQSFPTEFFTSKYILTCNPIDDLDANENSIVKNLDKALKELSENGKFELVKEFDFENGYVFYCFERVAKVDEKEIEYLKDLFSYQSSQFPEMFYQVLDVYVIE